MAAKWEHPKLGRFEYDEPNWVGTVDAPGFDAFAYDGEFGDGGPPTGKYELAFVADDETDVPSAAAVELALRVLADPAGLAAKVAAALWDDFTGRGPQSGMWWHGGLDEVVDSLEDAELPPPRSAKDLMKVMRLSQISVRKEYDGDGTPVIELCFSAAFEEEHGVGVLTDGRTVLGTGYHLDVSPFFNAE
jgi:hypothetical protein